MSDQCFDLTILYILNIKNTDTNSNIDIIQHYREEQRLYMPLFNKLDNICIILMEVFEIQENM